MILSPGNGDRGYSVSGLSNEHGFRLYISKKTLGPVFYGFWIFKTRNYHNIYEDIGLFWLLSNILSVLISMFFWSILIFSLTEDVSSLFFVLIVLPIFFINWLASASLLLALVSLIRIRFCSELVEWHSLEHKCAMILEEGKMPTVKNIKDTLATHCRCGFTYAILPMQLTQLIGVSSLIFLVLLGVDHVVEFSIFMTLILLELFLTYLILANIIILKLRVSFNCFQDNYNRLDRLHKFIIILSVPVTIVPLLLERIFALKNPSEEKIAEVSKDLIKFIVEHDLYKVY